MAGSGQVGSGQVDGNSDNKATSAQFQLKLPIGAELGNYLECLFREETVIVPSMKCVFSSKYFSIFGILIKSSVKFYE